MTGSILPNCLAALRLALLLTVTLTACTPRPEADSTTAVASDASGVRSTAATAHPTPDEPHRLIKGLGVMGYNYTNTEIGYYSVAHVGGGNVAVSTETAGGGSTTCCASVYNQLPPGFTVPVRWTRDDEVWCELQAPIQQPIPPNGQYLLTHFYPDGHVEVEVAETNGPPRLKMPSHHFNGRFADPKLNVNHDDRFATCTRHAQ